MTGPALGKLKLEGAKVYLIKGNGIKELDQPEVYIHLKGYALAKVTHLDIEHPKLSFDGKGEFSSIHQLKKGMEIKLSNQNLKIMIEHAKLSNLLKEGKTRTWVGFKQGGIYIGLRKPEIQKLEEIASSFEPFSP